MSTGTWVWIFSSIYWAYCIFWGIKGFAWAKRSSQWSIADRSLPMWLFLLAATATSFSGWTYVGHPGLIAFEGLAYAFASFYVLTIPITATFFAKRLWLLGRRYHFVTPGDLYSYYYGGARGWGEVIRWMIVLIAFLFSSFYTAVQLVAAGQIFSITTGVPVVVGSIFLAAIVFFYVAAGGIRSVAWVDAIQAGLLWVGIVIIGAVVLNYFGGWDAFSARLPALGPEFLEVPSAWNPGATGSTEWTGMFQLTYMFSLMGIMASPAFHMWTFANKDPRPFPWQQVFASTLFIGFALFFFTAIQGLGARLLLNDGVISFETDSQAVPAIIGELVGGPLAGLVVIGALAAMQSTGAAYMGTGGAMLMRDVYVRYLRPDAGHAEQIWVGRLLVFAIVTVAMVVAFTNSAALVLLGGLATAFGFLLYMPLIDVLFLRRFTAPAMAFALAFGIIAVSFTFVSTTYKYPLNLHSAAWGVIVGGIVGVLITLFTRKREQSDSEVMTLRDELTGWLRSVDTPTPAERRWRKAMWVAGPLWFIFAIGPGEVVGNNFISIGGMPSVWVWQITWWLLGFGMMWAMAFKAGMSRALPEQIERANNEPKPVVAEVGLRRTLTHEAE
ncbi:sodium:solute symporter family protein [Nonomuraea sp. 10N515B]|uniref:sodium:solute symporter family protein n=1 Tax=Nonomuraea sp. 10N515B TaxID=3457422 RepID=UPI003FCDFC91